MCFFIYFIVISSYSDFIYEFMFLIEIYKETNKYKLSYMYFPFIHIYFSSLSLFVLIKGHRDMGTYSNSKRLRRTI